MQKNYKITMLYNKIICFFMLRINEIQNTSLSDIVHIQFV